MILERWKSLSSNPLGRWIFNFSLGLYVPYTGSIHPEVLELSPGFARVRIRDRKKLRNHLNSIHAAALMNLSEVASGLAFNAGLPPNIRAIVTDFTVEYKKKARGDLVAECRCEVPKLNDIGEKMPCRVEAFIRDGEGDVVAIGRATWLVSPNKKAPTSP